MSFFFSFFLYIISKKKINLFPSFCVAFRRENVTHKIKYSHMNANPWDFRSILMYLHGICRRQHLITNSNLISNLYTATMIIAVTDDYMHLMLNCFSAFYYFLNAFFSIIIMHFSAKAPRKCFQEMTYLICCIENGFHSTAFWKAYEIKNK